MESEHEFVVRAFCRVCGLSMPTDSVLCPRCRAEARPLHAWTKAVGEDDWEEGGSPRDLVVAHGKTVADVLLRPGRFFGELGFESGNLPPISTEPSSARSD